jgi:hypothetical protein
MAGGGEVGGGIMGETTLAAEGSAMTVRVPLLALAFALTAGPARAEIPPPPDDVSFAYEAALSDLAKGKDRQEIADKLKPVVEKNPKSYYHSQASLFLADLTASAKNPPKPDAAAHTRLAESRLRFSLVKYDSNWDGPLKDFAKKEPKDPAVELVTADRAVIARLIPLLADRSPTRGVEHRLDGWPASATRVCDLALAIIEYHAKCRFYHDQIYRTSFHQFDEASQAKFAKKVGDWWAEYKDKPVAAGVRAQLPHAASYPEKVWMAQMLFRLGEGQKTDDKEFALTTLRDMVKQHPYSHVAAYVANALAELGDTSSVDVFHDTWKATLGQAGHIRESSIAHYLGKHGKRREWELMHAIATEELGGKDVPQGGTIWSAVVYSTNPYAIPNIGLALEKGRGVYANAVGEACYVLQFQVKKDFGYKRDGTEEERTAAIQKARKWWDDEGKAKYTFDYIEKNLVPAKDPKK